MERAFFKVENTVQKTAEKMQDTVLESDIWHLNEAPQFFHCLIQNQYTANFLEAVVLAHES